MRNSYSFSMNYILLVSSYRKTLNSSWSKRAFVVRTGNERSPPSLLTIQHYKGSSNIDSVGNYEWFFTGSPQTYPSVLFSASA